MRAVPDGQIRGGMTMARQRHSEKIPTEELPIRGQQMLRDC